ncbi:toll/interleukin-1 receptor domain-containing protein [Streptomyces triculaminicus]|uniref:toll/interleukin-1 receptor domain-containing protein n=1 Tax=Streptomyces triculaminicus TaxID=2816232 RepID=UPI0037D4264C
MECLMNEWIFISHSGKDKSLAVVICDYLSDVGLLSGEEFFCTSYGNLEIGDDDISSIFDHLDRSHVLVELVSASFLRSERCLMEVGYATARERYAKTYPEQHDPIRFFPLLVPPVRFTRVNEKLHGSRKTGIRLDSLAQCATVAKKLHRTLSDLGANLDEDRWKAHEGAFSRRCMDAVGQTKRTR